MPTLYREPLSEPLQMEKTLLDTCCIVVFPEDENLETLCVFVGVTWHQWRITPKMLGGGLIW